MLDRGRRRLLVREQRDERRRAPRRLLLGVALAGGTAYASAPTEQNDALAAAVPARAAAAVIDTRPEQLRDVGIDQHLDARSRSI